MNEYLLQHAIRHVWCNPEQDRQFVYKLARLTPRYGVRNSVNLFYERVPLPEPHVHYHIYQLGKIIPSRLGLPLKTRRWISLATLSNQHLVHTDLYVSNGIQFPRFDSHVWLTEGRNLIVAVKINERLASLEDQSLYLRVYSNAFFQSPRAAGKRHVKVDGIVVSSEDQLLRFQRQLADLQDALPGVTRHFVNGRLVHNISLTTAVKGDVVEYVHDGSIKRVVDFALKDLPYFHSLLDAGRKYILHYDDPSVTTIEYLDDVDVYLYRPGIQDRYSGVYYHHNEKDWLRMLTHKDYSIPVERLQGFLVTHPSDPRHREDPARWPEDKWESLEELHLRLYIRHAGYERPLVPDSHRIQELYKLPSAQILAAMTGADATLDLWKAENLERCPYVTFMSESPQRVYPATSYYLEGVSPGETAPPSPEEQVQRIDQIGEIYGYHAVAQLLAKTPSPVYVKDGMRYAGLPYEYQYNATVFEYNAQGLLLEWHPHKEGPHYIVRNSQTARVEAISGRPANTTNTRYGLDPVTLVERYNYRVYVRPKWGGTPIGEWEDITDHPDRMNWGYLDDTQQPRRWVWTCDPMAWFGAVRQDDTVWCREVNLTRTEGHLTVLLASTETLDGVAEEFPMEIPVGQLDLFLNRRHLIEGLDYQVKWPLAVIRNQEYLVPGDVQTVVVRGYSFCNADLGRRPPAEVGFVRHGVLSQDHQYDIHSHKLQRVIVDGRLLEPSDLVYDEDHNDLTIPGVRNGAPYVIQQPPVVLRDVFVNDLDARVRDDGRDRRVSDYLNERLPHHPRPPVDFIENPYVVLSVFANKLLCDLKSGRFNPPGMTGHYSEADLKEWCRDYEWLLEFDLANQDYDPMYINIWPYWGPDPVELNLYQYNLYVRALDVYLRQRLNVTPFVNVVRMTNP